MQQATTAAVPSTSWLSRLRELAIRAVDLHLQHCAVLAESNDSFRARRAAQKTVHARVARVARWTRTNV